ncbi:hypothetical protein VSX64_23240 [Aurantimonas sp. C2-6-R+9]|uniref:hypothetical protein n=1 Tax=unclassified Aurantimonas TaxID=2638230 RepID=UPI002E189A01|nr:hypothetical protein [Aurantimonas sp. C2-6-R+9]
MTVEADIAKLVGDPRAVGKQPITTDELADLLDLSVNRVLGLARAGHIPRVSAGRFERRAAVRAYCSYVRKNPVGRGTSNPAWTEAKTRAAEAQAEKLETANAIARRELIPAVEVEREWSAILRDVRSGLLALPSRLQQRLGHLTTHDITTIDREIRDALAEIANE